MIPNLYDADTMPAHLARFPIRCGWAGHDAPAVVAVRSERPCCTGDNRTGMWVPTCVEHAADHPVGAVAERSTECRGCGEVNAPIMLATRRLNEGDLP